MKTLYIHIGHYKTGSSAIQKYCADSATLLDQNGYHYPTAGRTGAGTNHADLSITLAAKHGFKPPPWYQGTTEIDAIYAAFTAEVAAASQENVLISSEEFIQLALGQDPKAAITELHNRLDQFDVRILLYIREPMALLKSWYNEVNKGPHGTRTFPVFFKNLNTDFLAQWKTYRLFASVFGAKRIIVRSYKYTGMDHIRGFLDAINYAPLPTGSDMISAQEAQDLRTLELERVAKKRAYGYDQATLSQFGDIKLLAKKVRQINFRFAKLSALSDTPLQSELSLVNIFRYMQDLIIPLKEQEDINDKEADIMRAAAQRVEDSDLELAIVLMQLAHTIRPNGDFIKQKLHEYNARQLKID